jgi:hypothetical protein
MKGTFYKSNSHPDVVTPQPEDMTISKQKDLTKNFTEFIEYIIEFSHLMPNNFSQIALGGRDAK